MLDAATLAQLKSSDLKNLPPSERRELQRLLKNLEPQLQIKAAQDSFERFCYLFPSSEEQAYYPTAASRLIVAHLEAVDRGELRYLIVAMPPRHGKSFHCTERFSAWYRGRHPERNIILTSYGEELAQGFSRVSRDIVMDGLYPFPDVKVRQDVSGVGAWAVGQGGRTFAVGRGGTITGRGASLFIADDLIKDREEADSELMREKAWRWFSEVAFTRLEQSGSIIIPMTHWHEDDIIGRLLNGPRAADWTVLVLPALGEAVPNIGCRTAAKLVSIPNRPVGEPLFPQRYPAEALEERRTVLGPRAWSALYQQHPSPEEGATFKRSSWCGWTKDTPPAVEGRKIVKLPAIVRAYNLVDSAFKEGVANDYSVCATWGRDAIGNKYLLRLWRRRVEFPELIQALESIYKLTRVPLVIEDKASGQSAIQVLRRAGIPVIVHDVGKVSKVARAESATIDQEARRLFLPWDGTGLTGVTVDEFIEEHAAFPLGAHDDMVDTTAMAVERLSRGMALPKPTAYKLGGSGETEKYGWDPFALDDGFVHDILQQMGKGE